MLTRHSIGVAAVALLLCLSPALATAPSARAWTHGRWFDGTSFKTIDVYSVGPRLTLVRPRTIDRTIDLGGRSIVSAFGEAHNHNIPGPDIDGTIRRYLEQGIFYVMIQGNSPRARDEILARVNTPRSVDVVFANGLFTSPGGHPSALVERNIGRGAMTEEDRDGGFLHPVSTTDNIDRAWWQSVKTQHPDFIKLALVYSEDRRDGLARPAGSDRHGLDPRLVAYLVRLAHRDRLRVAAHVESAYDFEVAVHGGADVISHLPGFWPDPARIAAKGTGIYAIGEEVARLAGRRHVTVVTTIGESLQAIAAPAGNTTPAHPELAGLGPQLLDLYRRNLDILATHGVRIAIGSDQFRGTSVAEALAIARAGLMSPAALLRALSSGAAMTILPARGPFGLVEGAAADFLALDGDPLEDFTNIQRISLRVKDGDELVLPPR